MIVIERGELHLTAGPHSRNQSHAIRPIDVVSLSMWSTLAGVQGYTVAEWCFGILFILAQVYWAYVTWAAEPGEH